MKSYLLSALLVVGFMSNANAGDILFVNFNGSDGTIATALSADGHSVTQINVPPSTANTFFSSANLDTYCAVVWSGAYAFNEDVSLATTILTSWVNRGGSALVTAPDAVRAQSTDMVSFLGGSSARDENLNFSTVANIANSVTTGLLDIRGQTPPDIGDQDTLCGPLLPGTIGLVSGTQTPDSSCPNNEGYAWTLRSLGAGEVAFITSGNFLNDRDPDWSSTAIPGDGVYNAAVRNFAAAGCRPNVDPPQTIPALQPWGLLVMLSLLLLGVALFARGRFA